MSEKQRPVSQGRAAELARRRYENRLTHYADKAARATTPIDRAAMAWDQWRGLVRELPEDQANALANQLQDFLTHQINQMTPAEPKGDDRP